MVDFKIEFGKAVGGIAAIGLQLNEFSRAAENEIMTNPDKEMQQAAKGGYVLAQMVRADITKLLMSLRPALVEGAPDHLKQAIGEVIDSLQKKTEE